MIRVNFFKTKMAVDFCTIRKTYLHRLLHVDYILNVSYIDSAICKAKTQSKGKTVNDKAEKTCINHFRSIPSEAKPNYKECNSTLASLRYSNNTSINHFSAP